ncbi:hypothetical protein TCAL_05016 [Tigriopus californicus]|uniref:MARVEL domain-containing protein n=1 Tax=Tigriopus californicus TaxID=6832 RepID=A0A553PKW7_TIGCA|nr:uncharacterized protein LOC131891212 [Tigriopus californicus]TRY78313.1 hypothetical protein TCAL_05016 [Tigriopus californicus]|eukprot:TCALIF_05016-PA protein Name:"Protein of unknown function" AED:0.00 eAED:0.00 QI:108/1/1/1/0.5/0.66/3/173/180
MSYHEEGGLGELCSIGGGFKLIESVASIICCMLHRIGNRGQQIFFGATDMILHSQDDRYETEADTEIIGSGTVTAFAIISPLLLMTYIAEGRSAVQRTFMDAVFSLAGGGLFLATGGMTCFAWNNALTTNANIGRRDYEAAGALGVMSLATGVLYIIDFFYLMYRRSVILEQEEMEQNGY